MNEAFSKAKVSVVVPALNAERSITACLDALCRQNTSTPYEIILVDDGSSDRTAEIAETYGVRVIRHRITRGAAAARNSGTAAASGEIICFTDADCEPQDNWIAEIVKPFADDEIIGAKGIYATRQKELVARFVQIEYEDKYDLLRKQAFIDFIDTYSAAYRRPVLEANFGFDEQMTFLEDQELSFRLAARGYHMVFHAPAVVYHLHSSTLHAYMRKKFVIGFWKAQVTRRFPGRVVHDSHTPQVLKAQILLVGLAVAAGLAVPFLPWAAWIVSALLACFLLSSLPFIAKAWSKDRVLAFAAPALLAARATALGFGYAWGLVRQQPDTAKLHTIDGLNYVVKRGIDIVGALIGLLLTVLLAPFVALAIRLETPGPVIFKQERIGEQGRAFILYKFRSMRANAQAELAQVVSLQALQEPVYKQKDDPRLTRVGKTLRRWSLDEFPQFWNVLKGEMSLVGPRPEETQFVALYDDWQRRRLAVKPGMTGVMQINGRGELPLNIRVQYDLDYIEHYSLWRDMVILVKTIPAVIRGRGAI